MSTLFEKTASAIKVGPNIIGPGHPVFIVAEIGVNHNGDMGLARECIDAAAEAGADAVKFQNFRTEEFILDKTLSYTYQSQGEIITETQFEMFKRLELKRDALGQLKSLCDSRGIIFFSTPASAEGVDDLVAIGTPMLKNGSDCLTHLPLIRAMGATGLPTVLSTGMADIAEIQAAADAFRETGNNQLILLACTSLYPTPAVQANVARVAGLASRFHCLAGFSDHTDGNIAAIASVCFGSCFLEKHFTLDRALPGPDHRFSIDPTGLRALVDAIREAEQTIGDGRIQPSEGEAVPRQDYRLSCVAGYALAAGTSLAITDIAFSRPGYGLAPGLRDSIVGRNLKHSVPAGHRFSFEDFV